MSASLFVHRLRSGVVPALAAWLATTSAHAAEVPTADKFNIRYYKTRDDGERAGSYQFSKLDMTQYINRARCECGQDISTKIVLTRAMSNYDPSVRVTTFVGSRCDQGQTTAGVGQVKPCARIVVSSPSTYLLGLNFSFEPIWLADGIVPGGSQDIEEATPAGKCDSGQGDGGIWICIENGMVTDCQADEFVIQGTQNENSGDMPQALHYDFSPPTVLPSSFSIQEGDGAIKIEWDQQATGDGNGFRVLCADANGNPLPEHGLSNPPSLVAVNQGTNYWTQGNLCPDGPFPDANQDLPDDLPDDTGGTDDGGSTDGGTAGSSGSSSDDGGSTFIPVTDSGSGSSGGTELPANGIESLDWAYVCTGHLAATARSARIDGLDNDVEYQFLVVAYDAAGNPAVASDVLVGSPRETLDLWEQCEIQGDVCGDGGFCACTAEPRRQDAVGLFALAGVGLVGWARRRRRR